MNKNNLNFGHFLDFFPEVELPIHLIDENLAIFSKENKILPMPFIVEFIAKYDRTEIDEFTEYIPCFRVPRTENFHAVVYWKAQLLTYEFHLVTFDNKGTFITGKIIAGMISNGNTLIKSVATIDEDWIIHIVTGEDGVNSTNYEPENSKAYSMEIVATGDIIFSLNNKDFE